MAWLGLFFATGCASVAPERGHDEVARLVAERAGAATGWEAGAPEETAVAERLDALLASGLTRRSAVAIALLNNPGLQRTYEELGVSQSDMLQAGLLKNPTLSGSFGIPILGGGGGPEFEFSLVQDIVDLITLSWRKDVAQTQFKARTLRVAQEALGVVKDVNQAFVMLQANLESQTLMGESVQASEGAHLLAEKQFIAGNTSELSLANERASFAQLQLERNQAEVKVAMAREKLNRLLGLWGKRARWEVTEPLPEVPASDPLPEHPEALAVRQRLDIEAARLQAVVLASAVDLARSTRLFGRVELGAHAHQDADGPRLVGPTLVLERPLFDQRQVYIARLEAEHRAATRLVSALAVDARSKVRDELLELQATRQVASYFRDTLVPLREKIVAQSQLHYNGMLLGAYQLISARQASLETRRDAIAARRDYWIARFELESALGGALAADGGSK